MFLRPLLDLSPLRTLAFGCCCSFWFFVAIRNTFSFDHLVFAVVCLVILFLVLPLVSSSDQGLFGAFFVVTFFGMRDGPGSSCVAVEFDPIGIGALLCFAFLASSKQNFLIFSGFRLYSPTVLHATIWISRGFVSGKGVGSVAITRSLFLITVFFLNGLSIVIVCGV